MSNLQSKRFVVRKSLIGKNQIIEVTFKNLEKLSLTITIWRMN